MVTKRPRAFFYRIFGQKHFIAHGHIEQIVNGPQLKCMDVVGLSHLSVQMQNCWLILTQMGYEADTNSSDNLVKIVKRLPLHLQSKWANEAGNLTLTGIESTFSHLAKFLEGKAMLASTMYGEIVGSAPDKERNTKQPSKEKKPLAKTKEKFIRYNPELVMDLYEMLLLPFQTVLCVLVNTDLQSAS